MFGDMKEDSELDFFANRLLDYFPEAALCPNISQMKR